MQQQHDRRADQPAASVIALHPCRPEAFRHHHPLIALASLNIVSAATLFS
jgi:hypothetical protein